MFGSKQWVGWVGALVCVWLALPVMAAQVQVEAGRSYMDRDAASTVFAEVVWTPQRLGDSRFTWAPDAAVGWIDGRDLPRFTGDRYTATDDVWLLAAGVRLQYAPDDRGRGWFVSLQPALQSGRTQALSGGLEFVSTLGWQGRRFSLQLRHVSNAGLQGPNRGETMALVGVGFDL